MQKYIKILKIQVKFFIIGLLIVFRSTYYIRKNYILIYITKKLKFKVLVVPYQGILI